MQLMIIDALLVQISHNRIGEKLHWFKRACLDTNALIQKIRQKNATYCQIMAFFTESSFPDDDAIYWKCFCHKRLLTLHIGTFSGMTDVLDEPQRAA